MIVLLIWIQWHNPSKDVYISKRIHCLQYAYCVVTFCPQKCDNEMTSEIPIKFEVAQTDRADTQCFRCAFDAISTHTIRGIAHNHMQTDNDERQSVASISCWAIPLKKSFFCLLMLLLSSGSAFVIHSRQMHCDVRRKYVEFAAHCDSTDAPKISARECNELIGAQASGRDRA